MVHVRTLNLKAQVFGGWRAYYICCAIHCVLPSISFFSFFVLLACNSPRPNIGNPNKTTNTKVSFQQQKKNKKNAPPPTLVIPPCSCCGAERRFEFQLMPSMLHVLEVDKHATATTNHEGSDDRATNLEDIMSADYGGMNWGVVAVYTCPNGSGDGGCSSKEEILVVQASVDATPQKRSVAPSDVPVYIPEDQTFDAQTEEDNYMVGCNNDDFDDDETVVGDEEDLVFTPDG